MTNLTRVDYYSEYNHNLSRINNNLWADKLLDLLYISKVSPDKLNKFLSDKVFKKNTRPNDVSIIIRDSEWIATWNNLLDVDFEVLKIEKLWKYLWDILVYQTKLYDNKKMCPKLSFYLLKRFIYNAINFDKWITFEDYSIIHKKIKWSKELNKDSYRKQISELRSILKELFSISSSSKSIIELNRKHNEYELKIWIKLILREEEKQKNNINYNKSKDKIILSLENENNIWIKNDILLRNDIYWNRYNY